MASRSLDDLAPPVKAAALRMLELCRAHPVRGAPLEVLIYCTLRSNAEQAALYEQGRTKPGQVVTNARAGESLHNPDKAGKAWAFDCVPMSAGKLLWNDLQAIEAMGELGKRAGLEWAGDWHGFKERVHFQIRPDTVRGK